MTLPRDLASLVEDIAQSLSGAEVVLLNFDSTGPVRLARSEMIDLQTNRALVLPIDVDQILSAAAYMVTREACLRLVKGLLPISAKADEWAIRFNAGMIDRVRCIVPIAVTKSSVFSLPPWTIILAVALKHEFLSLSPAMTSAARKNLWHTGDGEFGAG